MVAVLIRRIAGGIGCRRGGSANLSPPKRPCLKLPPDLAGGATTRSALDVPRRSSLRAHQRSATLLGSQGVRPEVRAQIVREYTYAFGAVSPHDGVLDTLVLPEVNAETMSIFLSEVAQRHPNVL